MAVAELSLRALEERVERLDAKARVSPGQLGLDFSAPAASPPKPKPAAAAGKGPGGGEKCGAGWIDPKKECRKNGPTGTAPDGRGLSGGGGAVKVPQVSGGMQAKPMSIASGGDKDYDIAQEREKYKGGLRFWRSTNGRPGYHYWFRDKEAAAHWMAEDDAKADADAEVGSDKRRSKEWQAEFKASYSAHRNMLRDVGDYDMLVFTEDRAMVGKATRGGTAVDVRIAGNKHSRPIREGFFDRRGKQEEEAQSKVNEEPVLTNPDRYDPGLAPKAKPEGINAQDVTTSTGQAQLARQQRRAAQQAGDQKGAEAWRQQERAAERDRLQNALSRGQQSQASLFGVTEYDETMPLFRQRRDSVDPVAQLCSSILREQLPGAQVLDWSRQPRGITAGRAVSEGLVYRFRLDAESIGYQPAWEGIDEQQWELRSEGFLAARDPSARLDYKRGLKFQQKTTKRQCSKGYGCGSACISLNKECRVQPKSAISKVRLRQLQALAQEGDVKAAAQAQELQMQREAKAQGLQKGRQTARLEKMLEDPRVAEIVRTGKVPEAATGAPKPGEVRNVKPADVEVDPERFQYKIGSSATGEVGSLSGVQRWDPNLAGVISVWQDPEDGKTYVVNGHNRLALAKRLGAEEVTVRHLKAGSAQEARAIGAMQNIAEGAGSEIDAGKFFRDTGVKTIEEVKAKGLPLNSGKAEKGLALAQLPDEMFNDVVQGNLRMRRAAVIGASGLDHDKQREVYKVLKARPSMTDETLEEYVQHLAVSSRQKQEEIDLFGTSEKSVDTGLARAELANGLKKSLGREARLLGAVSKSTQAVELLEQKGGNTINVEQSQQQADEASSVLRFFDQLKSVSGPVAAALDQAAARVTAGENRNKVARELRQQVVQAMEEELKRLGLRKEAAPVDELTMNLFDSADRFDSLLARIDALRRKCQTGYACGSSCISADKDCRSEGRATTGKERLKRLEQAAQGGATGRGIGRLKGGAAAAKVEEIKASRSEQAVQLRQQRAQRRPAGGALVPTGGSAQAVTPEVVTPEVMQPGSSTGRPGSIASTMREMLNAMKAADARQMGMVAEQLFETNWLLERRGRYRGMSKDQAREQYKAEFMQKLHKEASSPEAAARRAEMGRRAAESGSVSGAMRSLVEQMKASDDRLNDLTRQAIDLRVGAEEQFGGEGDDPGLGGSSNRRRLGRGRRRDAVDDRFDAAIDRLTALSVRLDQRCKRPDGSYYGTSGECRKGKLAGAARGLGQRIKGLGRRLLGRGAKVSEADAMAAAERIQQMAAARKKEEAERQAKEKAREQELLSRGPQEWGVKQVEKNEVRGRGDKGVVWHESRYEVQLEEPLRLPARPGKEPRLVDKLSFQVAVDEANAKPIARKLGEQGIALSNGQVNNALELAWLTGAGGGEAFMGADRMELPKNVARRFAMEVSKQVKGLVSNMEEGQIVLCEAHQDDGYGDKRRSLYERAGFTFIDGTGIAVVRNGRLSRIEGARGDRLDAGDAIDLDRLILALLTLGGDAR